MRIKTFIHHFLLILLFVGGIFVNVDFSGNIGDFSVIAEIQQAQANTGTATETQPTDTAKSFATAIDIFNNILSVIMVIVSPIILLAGWLMSPDWVTGDIFGLRDKMYSLWIVISNVLYFVYAIFLIVIAVATIFNYQPYNYKSMLPRLFIGIILIPLTWWFVQFIVSTATVATASVLKIPSEIMQRQAANDSFLNKSIPSVITFTSLDGEASTNIGEEIKKCNGSSTSQTGQDTNTQSQPSEDCTTVGKIYHSAMGIYSPIFIYAYGIFELDKVHHIKTQGGEGGEKVDIVKTVSSLANGLIFNTILFFIFGILTIALVCVLLIRGAKLWLYAIFSPLFTAKVVFKDWKGEGSEMFDIKEFIGLAFVPAVVGLALSFGLIVVGSIYPGVAATDGTKNSCDMKNNECVLMTIAGNPNNTITQKLESIPNKDNQYTSITTVKFGELSFKYKGSITTTETKVNQGGAFLGGFGTIIIQFIALIFIWIAFISASKVSKGVKAVVEPFENIGKGFAEMGKQSVKMVPLPGVGNVHGIEKTMRYMEDLRRTEMENKAARSTIGQKLGGQIQSVKVENAIRNAMSFTFNRGDATGAESAGNQGRQAIQIMLDEGYSGTQLRTKTRELISAQIGDGATVSDINAYIKSLGISDKYESQFTSRAQLLAYIDKLGSVANGDALRRFLQGQDLRGTVRIDAAPPQSSSNASGEGSGDRQQNSTTTQTSTSTPPTQDTRPQQPEQTR